MQSEIRLGADSVASVTNANRPMVGQAPYVVNAGVTYAPPGGRLSGTVLYNVVGRRIVAAGPNPLPDVYEQPRHGLDVSLRAPVGERLDVKLDGKNLLDAPHELRQGPVIRERYTTGRSVSLGLTWHH